MRVNLSLFKHWWFWLGLVVFLPLLGAGVAFTMAGRSVINQANFDRIQQGMTKVEVDQLLGPGSSSTGGMDSVLFEVWRWSDGPSDVWVVFYNGKMRHSGDKHLHLATTWEQLCWHCRKIYRKCKSLLK